MSRLAAKTLMLMAAAQCACGWPPPQHALLVRDPDKLCRMVTFSRCTEPEAEAEADAGEPTERAEQAAPHAGDAPKMLASSR